METKNTSVNFIETEKHDLVKWHVKNELKRRIHWENIDKFIFCSLPFDAKQKEQNIIVPMQKSKNK